MSKHIFVSYSHEDRDWLRRLRSALAPFESVDEITVFDDTMIAPGGNWSKLIEDRLVGADVCVLLVSTALLASTYVAQVELPAIVEAARSGRTTLVWVPISSSVWEVTPLAEFQAAVDPFEPLDLMSEGEANRALVSVAKAVAAGRTLTEISRSLTVVDRVADALDEREGRPHGVVARHTGESVVFERTGVSAPLEVIRASDLEELPNQERLLVRSLEISMEDAFERWTLLRPRRNRLTGRERSEFVDAGSGMCAELHNLLDFIELQLGKHLDDHYHAVRFACDQLIAVDD